MNNIIFQLFVALKNNLDLEELKQLYTPVF